MKKIKQFTYGVLSSVLMLSPLVALASGSGGNTTGGWGAGWANAGSGGLPGGSIFNIIQVTMKWLLGILGFIAIIGFVIAGILYLTAAGNESQLEKAKSAMTYSIIGVIVALVGYVIVQAVSIWLGGADTAF